MARQRPVGAKEAEKEGERDERRNIERDRGREKCMHTCRQSKRERKRGCVRARRCIDAAHGQVLCAFLLEQSAPGGIGTPLSTTATELPTELVAVGQRSVNTGCRGPSRSLRFALLIASCQEAYVGRQTRYRLCKFALHLLMNVNVESNSSNL